jgi:alpha,alpha-trehalase
VGINSNQLDAVLFDLDEVMTQTARVHAAAWKQLFDAYLQTRAERTGELFQPFETGAAMPKRLGTVTK